MEEASNFIFLLCPDTYIWNKVYSKQEKNSELSPFLVNIHVSKFLLNEILTWGGGMILNNFSAQDLRMCLLSESSSQWPGAPENIGITVPASRSHWLIACLIIDYQNDSGQVTASLLHLIVALSVKTKHCLLQCPALLGTEHSNRRIGVTIFSMWSKTKFWE